MTSESPKYSSYISYKIFVLISFNDSVKHINFFTWVLKSSIDGDADCLEQFALFLIIKKKKKNKHFVKKEFRKSRIFGGSDAMNFKLLQFSPKQQNIVRGLQSIDTFLMAIYQILRHVF